MTSVFRVHANKQTTDKGIAAMSELRKEIEDCAKSIRISEEKLIKLRDRHEIMSKMHQPSNLDLYHNFEIYVDAVEHKEYEFTEQLGGDGRSQPFERQV